MSRRLLSPMPADIIAAQRRASDPERSVWVRANAGSGKTYVLTARVLRLLLGGARPEEILCLTYTKAAAAEMRDRVAKRLGKWALDDEAELVADLTALTGAPPTAGMRIRARTLFAHALETPGGLRIQTIHAFCEAVLHRFPGEAGVPFDFAVLEEHERDGMLLEAREMVLAEGLRGSANADAVDTLFGLLSDFQIEQAIVEALNQQRTLRRVLENPPRALRTLRQLLGDPGRPDDLHADIVDGYPLTRADHDAIFAEVSPKPGGTSFVDRLAEVNPDQPDADSLLDAFLTKERQPRARLLTKAVAAKLPELAETIIAEADRLCALHGAMNAAELYVRSAAMLEIVAAISARYEAAKRGRSLLDFDDLIESLSALLRDPDQGLWVRYKLDAGLSHILVDEGQDTNPEQWRVVGALIDDFFFGDSAADRPRTLFAVGDQKQSIFSFQGADPLEFVNAQRQYAFSARAVDIEIVDVPMRYSFRTLPNLLRAVDTVFRRDDLREGALEDDGLLHETARAEKGGSVTLWPLIEPVPDPSDDTEWPLRPPESAITSAPRQVAQRIAGEIRGWLDSGRPLGPRGRPVRADDILILVQVRSVLFHEIIRALNEQAIPTPGADRLGVTTHLGVLDMMALGDVLSNPADDLQLAALLRSPLFDVTEEDLLALAHDRGDKTQLWRAMAASTIPSVLAAYAQLTGWRSRLDFDRPFNFYADVLYAGGGLQRMRARFGPEIDDVMAAFLDLALAHEQATQPSLLGFLAELRSRAVTIKRELADTGNGVRVMTVHGAKGLEAPIVIMADAGTTERGRDRRSVYLNAEPPLFIHAPSTAKHAAQTLEHKANADAARQAEYWRKLYVAMTRAEDELYVTGYLTRGGKPEGSWYEAIASALLEDAETLVDDTGTTLAHVYPRGRPDPAPVTKADGKGGAPTTPLVLPPLPEPPSREILRPSALGEKATPERLLATRAEQSLDPETARLAGTALHALLQHLGRVPEAQRRAVGTNALLTLLPDAPDLHAGLVDKALSIMTRPELAALFGPQSRAEVPFLAHATRDGAPVTIAGRIDRLLVSGTEVLVVDFKSDANPVMDPELVSPAYRAQLAVYARVATQLFPSYRVRAAILWTSLESLLEFDSAESAEPAQGFTIR